MKIAVFTVGLTLLLAPSVTRAEPVFEPHLQYRPRAEIDHRFGTNANFLVTHRARFSLRVTDSSWGAYIEPQDVRTWGFEPNTTTHRASVDIHQGYAEWKPNKAFEAKLGRQEVIYYNHRLIGNLDWVQTGRSFDALRVRYKNRNVQADAFAAPLSEATGKGKQDAGVVAATAAWTNAGRTLAVLGISDWNPQKKHYRWTFGPYSEGKVFDPMTYRAEAYWQQGHDPKASFQGYLLAGELGYPVGPVTVLAGYDRLSGTDTRKGEDYRAFDTLFATNHKFYGTLDLFLNIPKDTAGRGLQDGYGSLSMKAGKAVVALTGHRFWTERPAGHVFGTEWDVAATYTITPAAQLHLLYGVLSAGEAFKKQYPKAPDYPNGTWAMVNVKL